MVVIHVWSRISYEHKSMRVMRKEPSVATADIIMAILTHVSSFILLSVTTNLSFTYKLLSLSTPKTRLPPLSAEDSITVSISFFPM